MHYHWWPLGGATGLFTRNQVLEWPVFRMITVLFQIYFFFYLHIFNCLIFMLSAQQHFGEMLISVWVSFLLLNGRQNISKRWGLSMCVWPCELSKPHPWQNSQVNAEKLLKKLKCFFFHPKQQGGRELGIKLTIKEIFFIGWLGFGPRFLPLT